MHRTELANGDIVVVAVLPRGVNKSGGTLLETVACDDALENAPPELKAAVLDAYRRVIGDRETPTRRSHTKLEPSAFGSP